MEKPVVALRASFIPAWSGRDVHALPLTIEGLVENLKCVTLVWEMQKVGTACKTYTDRLVALMAE